MSKGNAFEKPRTRRETGHPLNAEDFVCIASMGFGDPENNRAQSIAWFQGRLYVGITRQNLKNKAGLGATRFGGSGVSHPSRYVDQRGQIWRYDPRADRWQRVFVSPLIALPDGSQVSREIGYRKMIVFQGTSEAAPALYVTTISILGSLLLRSHDGEHFVPVSQPSLEKSNTWSFRALVQFHGRLFTSPAGRMRGDFIERNASDTPVIFENADPLAAPWLSVNEVGFGDPTNSTIYEMASLNGLLYAGTFNPYKGFQIWKTHAKGDPYHWMQAMTDGAFRGSANEAVASMCILGDALYIGTGKQGLRFDKTRHRGSDAAELIRLYPDDSWELIIGEPRHTFEGTKVPLSGLGPGFNNPYNAVIWEMAKHDSWLYAGTENTSSFLGFLNRFRLAGRATLQARLIDNYVEQKGGFDLWRSRDGIAWDLVTSSGFGNPNNFGIESMLSTPAGLFIGTVGMTREMGGRPGGCEIWLGR
jgi:hypothetical protein